MTPEELHLMARELDSDGLLLAVQRLLIEVAELKQATATAARDAAMAANTASCLANGIKPD